jgi:hypothetical protein
MRTARLRGWLSLGALLAAIGLSAFTADPTFGHYELDLARSMQTNGPLPRSMAVTREATPAGIRQTTDAVQANGAVFHASYTAKYDGVAVPVTGAPFDRIAVSDAGEHALTDKRTKVGGLYSAYGRTEFSSDGERMTVTIVGVFTDGRPFKQVLAFDKH